MTRSVNSVTFDPSLTAEPNYYSNTNKRQQKLIYGRGFQWVRLW